LPFLDWGACPFECCTYRAWGVTKDTVVWKERRRSSPEAFRLKPGDRVVALTGVVVTTKAGRMKILKDTTLDETRPVRLHAGDVIYTLRYMGEGYDRFWFDGALHSDQISANTVDSGSPAPDAVLWVEALPETVWWVKVRNGTGLVGWTLVDENFDGADMDACS
jgi:hypothetical protein